ncbi:MAG: class I SAM-dependent methyltransferase, partial [Candidatus Omnitrophica bacterium]|nr:class I SAM-dependent methyltransferase [Candidatus Omnitrophota bacterium]
VHAVEPSQKAIEEGSKLYPFINFQRATGASMNYEKGYFDLVIINSVFHWVSRENLLETITKIDNVIKYGGYLIIGDFQIWHPAKKNYHHIKEEKCWTYKLDYKKIFLATGLYKEVATLSMNHDNKTLTTETDIHNYFSVSLLKKEDLYDTI